MVIGLCKDCATEICTDDKNKYYGSTMYECSNCKTIQDINEIEPYVNFRIKERPTYQNRKPKKGYWK